MRSASRLNIYLVAFFVAGVAAAMWLTPVWACETNEDCGESAECKDGYCVSADSSFTPAESSGGSGGSAGSSAVSAPEENNVDQRCWTKGDCETKAFGTFVGPNPETIQACKMEKDASNNLIGFCLPTAKAQMGLNWGEAGGQTSTFTHIGDFIKWIYKYGIVVAGVLAVMRIIFAGFDWVMSGGSQEKITGAHKKIGGALMGLFLVLMAYSVLNLINPYLVNFRLPGIWMINSAGLVPPYCDAIKDKTFYLAKEASAEKFENTFATAMQQGFQTYDKIQPKCGWEYYVEGAADATCAGTYCGAEIKSGGACVYGKEEKKYKCVDANVAGYVEYKLLFSDKPVCLTLGALASERWALPAVDIAETELWVVCSKGDTKDVGDLVGQKNISDEEQYFALKASFSEIEAYKKNCEEQLKGEFKGTVLMMEMNEECDFTDEEHLIGRLGHNGVDLGDEGHTDKESKEKTAGKGFTTNLGAMNNKYFITVGELKDGLSLNIDATKIHDIDNTDEGGDRTVYNYLLTP